MSILNSRVTTVAVAAALMVGLSSVSAVGASMITSSRIQNETIRSVDVKDGTLGTRDMSPAARREFSKPGPKGDAGTAGTPGTSGTFKSYDANWSVIDRNVEGGGDAALRYGPAGEHTGAGSLGIRTGTPTDKTAFGDVTDFAGHLVQDLTRVSYDVYTTGENRSRSAYNVPSVTFEINPNLSSSASHYSSLVFVSDKAVANTWTTLDATDATTGYWFLTGNAGTVTGCTQSATPCSFDQVKAALNDGGDPATILSAAITKGKDYAFSGAVDDLVINDTTVDFEPLGVSTN